MAWSRTWPKVEGDMIAVEDMNDLNAELNRRAAISNTAFAEGDNLRQAIQTMRLRVHGVLPTQVSPGNWTASQFLDGNGIPYGPAGYASQAGYSGGGRGPWANIWEELFGAPRLAWKNESDGTEATSGGNWLPPKCSLADSDPYTFHANELYSVINALEWNVLSLTHLGNLHRESSESGASAQAALDAAWTALLAASASSSGTSYTNAWAAYWNDGYLCEPEQDQRFMSAAIPSGFTAARLVVQLFYSNRMHMAPDGSLGAPPQFSLIPRVGTTDPGTLTEADWDYGTPDGEIVLPDQLVNEYSAPLYGGWYTALTGLTGGQTNYICLAADDHGDKPQFIVDDGHTTGQLLRAYHNVLLAIRRG